MINHAIGADGVVSQECRAVVSQYGQTILDLLLAEVKAIYSYDTIPFSYVHSLISSRCMFHSQHLLHLYPLHCLQIGPA